MFHGSWTADVPVELQLRDISFGKFRRLRKLWETDFLFDGAHSLTYYL